MGAQTPLGCLVPTSALEMLASHPQKSSALCGQIAGSKSGAFLWILFQVIQPFRLFTEINHQFVRLVANRQQPWPHAVAAPKWISAALDAFRNRQFIR